MSDDYRKPGVELEPSPLRDRLRVPQWNAMLERAAGFRSLPAIDPCAFTGVVHQIPRLSAAEWKQRREAARAKRLKRMESSND
jgi:hypothetical protein